MMPFRNVQKGVVTLMGALFILIILALMLLVLQRMTSSDILDTSVQHDTVEALFVAESAVEHASFLYANNGGNCLPLAGTISNVGRGNFTITQATIVGSDCRIRVAGAVTSTDLANQSLRTIVDRYLGRTVSFDRTIASVQPKRSSMSVFTTEFTPT